MAGPLRQSSKSHEFTAVSCIGLIPAFPATITTHRAEVLMVSYMWSMQSILCATMKCVGINLNSQLHLNSYVGIGACMLLISDSKHVCFVRSMSEAPGLLTIDERRLICILVLLLFTNPFSPSDWPKEAQWNVGGSGYGPDCRIEVR